ncbi:hypothetical protein COU14_01025 [Candidatus Kaiserbacteria bacterium CG10_big_fil_rev_8_21_14_0_10_44_10]|uniref:SMC-Scp complex subunit ScpB n=1 Tax=Candidatus Kaiserbacteria bacterium CG10_big_fil_rev_8_21_14_0_10_44_10 TaxID=1974606 RepID=A0A2H0UI60_9BACT|nr:MAG: hypothetical protein COU14_01025 [Candidatus Kaiserbacteria bacterium CG10_big_fil_rev_8_21_14_0_10_44_10]
MELDKAIEALLFYKAEPIKKAVLMKTLGVEGSELGPALKTLGERLQGGATALLVTEEEVSLVIAPEFDELVDNTRKDEMKRGIGKAGAETLAIVMYRGPITRVEIDRIRGVNSSYILRNLEMRGLVERRAGKRQNEFVITTELLRHLGIREKTEMPDYAKVLNALEAFENSTFENDESLRQTAEK